MNMQLKDVMTKNVKVIPQNASVQDAAKLMKDVDVGSIPVISDTNQVVGIITDRDIVVRSTAEGRNPNQSIVKDVMTHEFFSCFEDDDVKKANKLMRERQIRRLPVINHQNELVGIVSLGDISVDVGKDKVTGETLEEISKPSKPRS
jgi:CBS domain-containing protein